MMIKKTLNPEDPFFENCNKIFLLACLVALCIDPLLFYVPSVDPETLCLKMDMKLAITVFVLRSFIDLFYAFRIFLKFRTGFIAPTSRKFGAGEFVRDSKAIMKRYMRSDFTIDILSILPLPQVLIVMSTVRSPIRVLLILTTAQNLVRFLLVFPFFIKVNKTIERPWGGAAYNFCLYMFASHVIGSFWYLASIDRANRCWRVACDYNHCNPDGLYCLGDYHGSNTFLISLCSPLEPSESDFDYGIYHNALRIQLYKDLFRRFFYCFVWGLRNLSSFGQNLETSNDVGENLFVVIISITGLILFSFLTSNIQRYLQSLTVRVDEMSIKLTEKEKWMSKSMLPEEIRWRVRQHEEYKWRKNRGVNEESFISDLPEDLRRDIKRYQCMSLLLRVPMFDKMDQQLIDSLCCCLKRVFYTTGTVVFCEGYPVDRMLFIKSGDIFGNEISLKAGDFCGKELLTWAVDSNSSSTFPISTTTLTVVDDVEAFSLTPDDLKRVVSQFAFLQSQQFEHNFRQEVFQDTDFLHSISWAKELYETYVAIFRLNSQEWRSWGAFIIQAAWRRYHKRKMERLLELIHN